MDTTLSNRDRVNEMVSTVLEGGVAERPVILTEKQRLVMEWLMDGGTGKEAAEFAGVCRQTVSEWLNHDEDFMWAIRLWKERVKATNEARLVAVSEIALETVIQSIREKRDVKTALAVLKSLGVLGK